MTPEFKQTDVWKAALSISFIKVVKGKTFPAQGKMAERYDLFQIMTDDRFAVLDWTREKKKKQASLDSVIRQMSEDDRNTDSDFLNSQYATLGVLCSVVRKAVSLWQVGVCGLALMY